jgi:hypothetical protein
MTVILFGWPIVRLASSRRSQKGRIEIGHHEQTGLAVFADEWRHRIAADPPGLPEPVEFVMVACDRRLPQPWQRALQTEPPPLQLDQSDVGGDAARQRRLRQRPPAPIAPIRNRASPPACPSSGWADAAGWVMIRLSLTELSAERP